MFSSAASRDSGCLFSSVYIHAGDCWCHTSVWPIIFMSCFSREVDDLVRPLERERALARAAARRASSRSRRVRLLNCSAISFARFGSSRWCDMIGGADQQPLARGLAQRGVGGL